MIKRLEEQLKEEIKARDAAMKPYNERIKNLKAAITNLKNYDAVADEMNAAEPKTAPKTPEN